MHPTLTEFILEKLILLKITDGLILCFLGAENASNCHMPLSLDELHHPEQ